MHGPDASNSCLPGSHPVVASIPPMPSPSRGERCPLTGQAGRLHQGAALVAYASNKLVVVTNLLDSTKPLLAADPSDKTSSSSTTAVSLPTLVYRKHAAPVTAVSVSKSGCYVASGDNKGHLVIWALDHPDHLIKYETAGCLSGPIRDLDWDGESKRVCVSGERAPTDSQGAVSKCLGYDTGVTQGVMGLHLKGRAASCSFKGSRPFRICTSGKDDAKVLLHSGPPFQKVPVKEGVPSEAAHTRGAVHCVRYNHAGTLLASVGTDKAVAIYTAKTGALVHRLPDAHTVTIYACAWSQDDSQLLTASGDGTVKLFGVAEADGALTELKVWRVAEHQAGGTSFTKVPSGGAQVGCTFAKGTVPVSVSLNGQLSVLKDDGGSIETITGHSAPIAAAHCVSGAQHFYTGDTDGVVCQWDIASTTLKCIKRLEPGEGNPDLMYVVHTGAVSGVASVGTKVLTVGWDDVLRVTKNGVVESGLSTPLGAQPSAVASGTNVAVVVTTAGLRVVQENGTVGPVVSIPYEALCVAVSKDDKTAFVGGADGKIYVYAIGDGDSLTSTNTLEGHLKAVHALSLSHDGTKLASADLKDVCVWNTSDGTSLVSRGKWCFHTQRITCLSWSHDDAILASGGSDDSVYLWNPASKMKRVHYGYCHRGGLVSLFFLPDLKLVTVGVDSVVNMFDTKADVKAKFG